MLGNLLGEAIAASECRPAEGKTVTYETDGGAVVRTIL